jgi:hypothetical protein
MDKPAAAGKAFDRVIGVRRLRRQGNGASSGIKDLSCDTLY